LRNSPNRCDGTLTRREAQTALRETGGKASRLNDGLRLYPAKPVITASPLLATAPNGQARIVTNSLADLP